MQQKLIITFMIGVVLLTACAGSNADVTPTLDPNLVRTQAVETFSTNLTQTALAAPTNRPPATLTASATFQPFTTSVSGTAPVAGGATIPATVSCYQMRFVSDVTIPDNTPMTPGQTFTKTWKVKNIGSCAWDAGFKFAFTGGDAMGGATYTLPSAVAANAEATLSVAMTAPTNKTGAIRGNWRMSTAGGQFFGDEIYVLIVIGGVTGTPPTATKTPNTPSYP